MTGSIRNAGDAQLFADCPFVERELLANLAVPLRVSAGEDIVSEGDFGSTIGVLIEGSASVWHGDDQVADLGPGDCFGEIAALAPPGSTGHRTARVHADSEVHVGTVTKADLNANLSELATIAERLREQAARLTP